MAIYSGALTPTVQRTTLRDSVRTTGSLPRFTRSTAGSRPRSAYALSWRNLTLAEADQLVRDFTYTAKRGTGRLSYVPDDGSHPIEVLCLSRPQVAATSRTLVSVSLELEEQR